jgi:8-oxo-dGTP pyrophosphatase MutT (NUDIX family)
MPEHATLPLWDDAGDTQKLDRLRSALLDLYRYQLGDAVARVISLIERHTPADAAEAAAMQRCVAMCREHPNIMNMGCEPGHLTGSALIVHAPSRRVLLNHHAKLNRWLQFGGHFDYETEAHRVALREAHEESGLSDLVFAVPGDPPAPFDIDAHVIPQRGDRPEHWHLDMRYLLLTASPDAAHATNESTAIRWFSFDEALALGLSAELVRMLRKARALCSQ